jgi:hypothetical protein
MTEGIIIIVAIWEIVQPYLIDFLTFALSIFILWIIVKYFIAILENLENISHHLSSIKNEVERAQLYISNLERAQLDLSNLENSISTIENEMKWWEKNTTANRIIERLEVIEAKKSDLSKLEDSVSTIENEMKWWEKNTTANQIIERLDAIENKVKRL